MDYCKINHFWQSLNLLAATILLTLLILFRQDMTIWMWLMAMHLPLLMLHEVEEYVLAPKSFKEFVNMNSPLGSGTDPDFPLDEAYIFQVNILIAWPVIILGALLADVAPWIGMSMIWFQIVVNNLMHTVGFQTGKPGYNPGLLTNCLLLVPFCVFALVTASRFFHWSDWALSFLVGGGISALLMIKTFRRLATLKVPQQKT
ncbi:MAG: HXXEE domain-containing protein [Chlorobium sp.]|nr:HXXEE domain-containing protein [Chlorobium sp.]